MTYSGYDIDSLHGDEPLTDTDNDSFDDELYDQDFEDLP